MVQLVFMLTKQSDFGKHQELILIFNFLPTLTKKPQQYDHKKGCNNTHVNG